MQNLWNRRIILGGLPGPKQLADIREQGVRRLINLSGVGLAEIYGTEALAPFDETLYVFADAFSQGNPVTGREDWMAVDAGLYLNNARHPYEREQLLIAIAAVQAVLRSSEPVFVFCEQGRSRSPLVVIAALVLSGLASLAEAVQAVQALQPRARLTDIGLAALRWSQECAGPSA